MQAQTSVGNPSRPSFSATTRKRPDQASRRRGQRAGQSQHDRLTCGLDTPGRRPTCEGCASDYDLLGPHYRLFRLASRFQKALALLRKLHDVQVAGVDRWTARCPVCRCPASLRVDLALDGTVLPKCGVCSAGAIARAAGVRLRDLFPGAPQGATPNDNG